MATERGALRRWRRYRYAAGMVASGEPPRNADDWSDEQWLAWLAEGDEDDEPAPPATRVQRSTGGRMLGNAMLGVAEAMYGVRRPEIVVEAEAPGDPHDDDLLEVHLDPDHPERSTVVVRQPVDSSPEQAADGPARRRRRSDRR